MKQGLNLVGLLIQMTNKIITRFAPSPTGTLHIGGARTALFAWLFAKSHQGKCLLRIEDTDLERSKPEYTKAIIDSFAWMDIKFDDEVFYQSNNKEKHLSTVNSLVESHKAYFCNCSSERLNKLREKQQKEGLKPKYDGKCRDLDLKEGSDTVVRFRNPQEGAVQFTDIVKGVIEISNKELDDLILVRSDGTPTYNLCVVVDDIDMDITHVIRGDDHINNTPRQINIFRALEVKEPIYGHVPMILGEDGKRLSKRHGAVGVTEYERLGVLPDALKNYLVRLGWSLGDQELFDHEELINKFKEGNINNSPSAFSLEKLSWFNKEYISKIESGHLLSLLCCMDNQFLEDEYSLNVLELIRDRCSLMNDFSKESEYFFKDIEGYDSKAVKKFINEQAVNLLVELLEELNSISTWKASNIQHAIEDILSKHEVGFGKVGLPLRIALTGSTNSPSIDKTAEVLGQTVVIERIEKAIKQFS
jgi:glutamyl-tRNA synthetase